MGRMTRESSYTQGPLSCLDKSFSVESKRGHISETGFRCAWWRSNDTTFQLELRCNGDDTAKSKWRFKSPTFRREPSQYIATHPGIIHVFRGNDLFLHAFCATDIAVNASTASHTHSNQIPGGSRPSKPRRHITSSYWIQ